MSARTSTLFTSHGLRWGNSTTSRLPPALLWTAPLSSEPNTQHNTELGTSGDMGLLPKFRSSLSFHPICTWVEDQCAGTARLSSDIELRGRRGSTHCGRPSLATQCTVR
eukprot:753820-Hanusia_phi.AAC.8